MTTRDIEDHQNNKSHCSRLTKLIYEEKQDYHSNKIMANQNNTKALLKLTNTLKGKEDKNTLSEHNDESQTSSVIISKTRLTRSVMIESNRWELVKSPMLYFQKNFFSQVLMSMK